ncbi:hypothetical protein AMTRI_Chr09g36800 [Amborella trichopoda]
MSLLGNIQDENLIWSDTSDEFDNDLCKQCSGKTPTCSGKIPTYNLHTLTKEDNFILDLIEKISDPDDKRQVITQFINLTKEKLKPVTLIKPPDEYNFFTIMKIISQHEVIHKKPTIAELKTEVNNIKIEVSQFKNRIQILELQNNTSDAVTENDDIEFDNLVHTYNFKNKLESSKVKIKEDDTTSLNLLNKVITQKWFVLVKIVVNNEYDFQSLALIDFGADLNCLNEGIVPTKYFDKTTQILYTVNGSRLYIKYKLSNTMICNNGHCFPTPFIMIKGLSRAGILSVPFLTLFYPMTITHTGIETQINNTTIQFEFLDKPKIKEINTIKTIIK